MNDQALLRSPSIGHPVPGISRRTIARGAAWTAPMLAVGVSAPAFAASQCVAGQASLMAGARPTLLTFAPSDVTASVAFLSLGYNGDMTPGETGEVHTTDYKPKWNYLKLHHPEGMKYGNTISIILTFSKPVTNLSLKITDIDKTTGEWIDEVIVDTAGYVVSARGDNVTGTGSSGDPLTTDDDEGIESAAGDATLTWAGPLSKVQITYRAADKKNKSDIGQHIGIGQIGFTC